METSNILNKINNLKSKKCRSVRSVHGSIIYFGFGDAIPRQKQLKNKNLSKEDKIYFSEIEICVICAWRLLQNNNIICGWRDSNAEELNSPFRDSVLLLIGQKIKEVKLTSSTYDLEINFENNLCLQIFCDITNGFDSDENYIVYFKDLIYSIGVNSSLGVEYPTVTP